MVIAALVVFHVITYVYVYLIECIFFFFFFFFNWYYPVGFVRQYSHMLRM